jgi:hypothetical protein
MDLISEFFVVLGFPIVAEMLGVRYKTLGIKFVLYALGCGLAILVPMYWIDSYFYGKTVVVSKLSNISSIISRPL